MFVPTRRAELVERNEKDGREMWGGSRRRMDGGKRGGCGRDCGRTLVSGCCIRRGHRTARLARQKLDRDVPLSVECGRYENTGSKGKTDTYERARSL